MYPTRLRCRRFVPPNYACLNPYSAISLFVHKPLLSIWRNFVDTHKLLRYILHGGILSVTKMITRLLWEYVIHSLSSIVDRRVFFQICCSVNQVWLSCLLSILVRYIGNDYCVPRPHLLETTTSSIMLPFNGRRNSMNKQILWRVHNVKFNTSGNLMISCV